MNQEPYGVILSGDADQVRRAYEVFEQQPVDWDLTSEPPDPPARRQVTIRQPAKVTGPGTFFGREHRTLTFAPTTLSGWWFERVDLADSLPIRVSVRNVWTTLRNIVLRSGSP
ncbi:MAG: hypothetical protein HYV36_07590, partial [Lentisphaerae bacterium]|nr:hypothetical protein [Lentisphaerota bacterium]